MKWDLYEQTLLSECHIRCGGYGGIGYYHVSDTYVALFSHFIPCGVWEAVYILDGLLKNRSDIQPDTVHADTQGQSTPVFGLAYLLGIDLMPRIRNWKDLKLFRPSKTSRYKHIDVLFTDVIDWSLIETHLPDMLRVVLSIQEGRISASTLLRKLGPTAGRTASIRPSRSWAVSSGPHSSCGTSMTPSFAASSRPRPTKAKRSIASSSGYSSAARG